jgi:hypothetical protein
VVVEANQRNEWGTVEAEIATTMLVFMTLGLSLSSLDLRAETSGSDAAERAVSDPTVLEQGPAS